MLISLSIPIFLHQTSSTMIMFTSHGETFDNNGPWVWVSICIFDLSVSFILFHFVSNPMNWLSFLGCFVFLFRLDWLSMFLLLVNRLCFMVDCWMYSLRHKTHLICCFWNVSVVGFLSLFSFHIMVQSRSHNNSQWNSLQYIVQRQ